ncbi:MAG: hypothetical protein J5846_07745 [Desulfovibrio sp.]|nr:hypothetical protein [Desulfovibrio sp.]
MYSTYFQLRYILERPPRHQASYALLYGLTFAVCLLTRVTNAVALLCGMACIFFNLLGHKQYKNILENTAGFLLGLALPVVLFALYFYRNDALFDCCYGTLLYNLEYQKHMVSWLTSFSSSRLYDFLLSYFPVYAMLFVSYAAIKRHNILFLIFSLLIFFSECYLFLSGALYPHYAVAVFPQFVIIINETVRFFRAPSFNKSFLVPGKVFLLLIFVVVGYLNAQDFAYRVARNYIKYNDPACIEYAHMGELLKEKFQGKALVVYGGENCKSFYLHYDFLPCYKYFVLQEWHAGFSPRLREDIRKVFSERKAYAIVVSGKDETIRDILAADYELMARDGDFRLYRIIAKTL